MTICNGKRRGPSGMCEFKQQFKCSVCSVNSVRPSLSKYFSWKSVKTRDIVLKTLMVPGNVMSKLTNAETCDLKMVYTAHLM